MSLDDRLKTAVLEDIKEMNLRLGKDYDPHPVCECELM